jgi:hypothetical protein
MDQTWQNQILDAPVVVVFSTQITQAAGFNWLQVLPILRGLEQFGGETDPRRCARMGCHIILYIKFSIDGGFPKWAYPKNHGFQH